MPGPEHPTTLTSKIILAVVLESQGKYEAAEEMHRRVLELIEKVPSPEHQGKYKETEEMHRRTLELRKKALGHAHRDTLASTNNLAVVLDSQMISQSPRPPP